MPASSGSPGRGRTVPDPQKVFINCPFDDDYAATLDALVFATVCCGFIPCSSLDSGTVARPRIDRILDGLSGAKYSLHDLFSRQAAITIGRFWCRKGTSTTC